MKGMADGLAILYDCKRSIGKIIQNIENCGFDVK